MLEAWLLPRPLLLLCVGLLALVGCSSSSSNKDGSPPKVDGTRDRSVSDGSGRDGARREGAGSAEKGPAVDAGASCGGLTFAGCCDGETAYYCEGGSIKSSSCDSYPECGWDSENKYYGCGTDGEVDPSGKNPISCQGMLGDGGSALSEGKKPDLGSADKPSSPDLSSLLDAAASH